MLELRLIGPFLALLVAAIGYGLEHHWDDGRTKKHRWAQRAFLALIVLVFVDSAFWTVVSHRREAREETRAAAEEAARTKLLDQVGKLNSQLAPFVKIAMAKYPGEKEDIALERLAREVTTLRKETTDLKIDLETVRQLSGIARLGARGTSDTVVAPLTETTPISKALEGAWLDKDGKLYPKCDPQSIQKFKDTIVLEKRFPFSYYALAECYKALGDASWQSYAREALSILAKTRKISPHHVHHDEVFLALSSELANKP